MSVLKKIRRQAKNGLRPLFRHVCLDKIKRNLNEILNNKK